MSKMLIYLNIQVFHFSYLEFNNFLLDIWPLGHYSYKWMSKMEQYTLK